MTETSMDKLLTAAETDTAAQEVLNKVRKGYFSANTGWEIYTDYRTRNPQGDK